MIDLVDAASRDSKIFARLGDRWDLMTADVVTTLDIGDDLFRSLIPGEEKSIRHSNQRNMPSLARTRRAVGLRAEQRSGRARIQEAAEDAALEVHHAASARAFLVVAIVTVAF